RMELSAENDKVSCAENQIKQACIAILMNSYESLRDHGEVVIRTGNPDSGHLLLEIVDNGVGISESDITRVFEPFFSAKDKVSGIGLGLSIVHGIIKSHNGDVNIKSELGKGTIVSILFPNTE
ncbi:sensor histidine kinase, partial [Bacteroidota bacterium]